MAEDSCCLKNPVEKRSDSWFAGRPGCLDQCISDESLISAPPFSASSAADSVEAAYIAPLTAILDGAGAVLA